MKFELIKAEFNNIRFFFKRTGIAPVLIDEIFSDNYKVIQRGLCFGKGDVIVDAGANEGIFSVMMAKLFPEARIYAFEPVNKTYRDLLFNISVNEVDNVYPFCVGFSNIRGKETMNVHKDLSGGSSRVDTYSEGNHDRVECEFALLDDLLDKFFFIDRIRLLKMDIEGSEYDALYNSSVLPRVDNFVGEFHINSRLLGRGYSMEELYDWVRKQTNIIHVDFCKMND